MPYVNRTDGEELTKESARKWFRYIEGTGELFRIMQDSTLKPVGTLRSDGHKQVGYNEKSYRTTTIIWLIKYGRKPAGVIDHKNGDPSDDRFFNLRECTQSQNMINTGLSIRNKSGIKGVSWDSSRQKWAVYICKEYKRYNLGRFDSLAAAEEAYNIAREKLFGEFFEQ